MQIQNPADIRHAFPTLPAPLQPHLPPAVERESFMLYGVGLTLEKLRAFGQKCGQNFVCFEILPVLHNTVVWLKGEWQADFLLHAHALQLDAAPLHFTPTLSQGGLLVMDMDSTAIQIECIDEIAKLAGTGDAVSAITAQAMRGELDFAQSLRQRVGTLKNAPERILAEVKARLPLMPGLTDTLQTLQRHGWKTAIASGGFTYFADHLKQQLNLDYTVSNRLQIVDGRLTGNVEGDIVDAQYKADTLRRLAQRYDLPLSQCVAVGDGANDLPMLNTAGLGVALHAKPKVQQQAQIVVNFADFSALLCLLTANDKFKE